MREATLAFILPQDVHEVGGVCQGFCIVWLIGKSRVGHIHIHVLNFCVDLRTAQT